MSRDPAPVALFAYRRPDHLARTLDSLRTCPEAAQTSLVVFADGSRGPEDADGVAAVRALLSGVTGFGEMRVVAREHNVGLAANVIAGVGEVLESSERVIVLEDDMVVSPDFLRYMNEALERYAGDDRVASIHGYVYPTSASLPDYFFLRGADCWGWGTWRRGWALFDPDGARLLAGLEALGGTEDFDFGGAFPYTAMLRDQIAGRVDSWAIRWYASAYLAGALTLYPGTSLVDNIGLDGSGTHSRGGRGLATTASRMRPLAAIPVVESTEARAVIADALRGQGGPVRWWSRLLHGARR